MAPTAFTERARNLVAQMSLEEKVALMSGDYGLGKFGRLDA